MILGLIGLDISRPFPESTSGVCLWEYFENMGLWNYGVVLKLISGLHQP